MIEQGPPEVRIIPLPVEGEIETGSDLARLALEAAKARGTTILDSDVLVVTQKAVSKSEGRIVRLSEVDPSPIAQQWADRYGKDARQIETVLRESRRIVKMDRGIIIAETRHGFVCANAGVDASNVGPGVVSLLPVDPDASAAALRDRVRELSRAMPAVIITDTFGRAWRNGLTNVAIGVAGIEPLRSFAGQHDPYGYELRVTIVAIADELASAAELVMGKVDGVPFALVRGFAFDRAPGGAHALVRDPAEDLFR
ncbi:MAG TPA: coenzyme F420-0:L-glutamate ligase [Chloroflexota bacterium]|nr:coenzyme F420-0:L-glutamate ligase [Chloroflexota bacterium]